MKAIRQRTYILALAAGIGMVVSALILACSGSAPAIQTRMLLIVSLPASACMATLWAREHRKLKVAQLIVENQMLSIRTATICDKAGDSPGPENIEGIEVFVSYFGILLDSRVIRFNQEGIFLKTVEIGSDSISFTYGTDKRVQSTRLIHAAIGGKEVERIAERFRHETGIIPVIID